MWYKASKTSGIKGRILHFSARQVRKVHSCFMPAAEVRRHFLDYFKTDGHTYIRSSSVKPFNDSTLEFVNAGMNQFKNVFLGLSSAPSPTIVNSQKCIRIGGKHNDLNSVGSDTYHHTFFEMLGNWSFGDYFKKEACKLAWSLITSPPYSLPPNRLYVTYFGGEKILSLEPDLETKEIWREIGIPVERILPFGTNDNFWEMGITGPCGPCTEIHYDHLGICPRSHWVNKGLPDLTELWNLVFIQYNREEDGQLTPLHESFVDTGMGLERLVAVLHRKNSNYDTDLFLPLFNTISKISKTDEYKGKFGIEDIKGIDSTYRILADHTRMITVALTDCMFPDQSHSLRRVIRKCLIAAEKFMPGRSVDLVVELSRVVAMSLGCIYPEVANNLRQVEFVLKDEFEIWRQVQSNVKHKWEKLILENPKLSKLTDVQSIGLISAVKELQASKLSKGDTLSSDLALILYDRYGVNPPLIEELAALFGLNANIDQLTRDILQLKEDNKLALRVASQIDIPSVIINSISTNFKSTYEEDKYLSYLGEDNHYCFKDTEAVVHCIISSNKLLTKGSILQSGCKVGILLDRTNFWTSLNGDSDVGHIIVRDCRDDIVGTVKVDNALRFGDYIIHFGEFAAMAVSGNCELTEWRAVISVDHDRRMTLMRNNTASHLITHIIKQKYVPNIKYFVNTKIHFTIKYVLYGEHFSEGELMLLEHLVNELIKGKIEIKTSKISIKELYGHEDIIIPPIVNMQIDKLPTIQLNNGSPREVSYGPNVENTEHVGEFCFVGIDINKNKKEVTFKCLTGPNVDLAYRKTNESLEALSSFSEQTPVPTINKELSKVKCLVSQNLVPLSLRIELNFLVNKLNAVIKRQLLNQQIDLVKQELARAEEQCLPFLVHCATDNVKLEKLTELSSHLPIMVFSCSSGTLTGKCYTPKGDISAKEWMEKVSSELGGIVSQVKGDNPGCSYNLRPMKLNKMDSIDALRRAKNIATNVANELLSQSKVFSKDI